MKSALTLCLGVIALMGCASRRAVPPATLAPFPGTPTAQCVQEEILPTITEIRPAQARPGSEVTVIASGGYLRDSCGGYHEGSRVYKIYVDDEPTAELSCYINHCEGKFTLSQSITAGLHCMGVQKGTCQIQLDVTEN